MVPRGLVRSSVPSVAFVLGLSLVACASSDETSGGPDAATVDAALEAGKALPSCVGEGGYQCQPKGCLSGFYELKGWDCGAANGSCCAKDVIGNDSGSDATSSSDAKND